jgi:hypothetical protein
MSAHPPRNHARPDGTFGSCDQCLGYCRPTFKFTPGPLTARRYVQGAQYMADLESRDAGIVATLTCAADDAEGREALDADANLFLAAHDALAACSELSAALDDERELATIRHSGHDTAALERALDLARRALATARGK